MTLAPRVKRPPPPASLPQHRSVAEADIVRFLSMAGWGLTFDGEEPAAVRAETQATLDRFIGLGLPFRDAFGSRLFDPAEVVNHLVWTGLEGRDPFWQNHWVASGRARYRDFQALAEESDSLRFEVSLRRIFSLARTDRSRPLRLRMPLPIRDAATPAVEVEAIEAEGLSWRIDGCRLEARGPAPEGENVTLSARVALTSVPHAIDRDRGSADRHLAETEGFVVVGQRVRDLADRLAPPNTPPRQAVGRFWDLLLDEFICGAVSYGQIGTPGDVLDWVLDNRWFDCQLGAALLVALCRASRIPARLVGGYLAYPSLGSAHYWAEVWLDEGWRPFDLMAWDLSLGGQDEGWRGAFAGHLEPRLKTACLPDIFCGPPGVPIPPDWHILTRRQDRATETTLVDASTAAPIYRDAVEARIVQPTRAVKANYTPSNSTSNTSVALGGMTPPAPRVP